ILPAKFSAPTVSPTLFQLAGRMANATRIWWTYQLAAAQAVLVAQTASLLYRTAASLRGVGWIRRARTYDALPTGQSAKQQVGQPALPVGACYSASKRPMAQILVALVILPAS